LADGAGPTHTSVIGAALRLRDTDLKRNHHDAPTRTVNGATRGSHSASDSSTEHAPRAAPRRTADQRTYAYTC